MIEIAGYIHFGCEIWDESDSVVATKDDILKIISNELDGQIAKVGHVIQNGEVGVYLFDFSNHLRASNQAIERLVATLVSFGKDIDCWDEQLRLYISVRDDETDFEQIHRVN